MRVLVAAPNIARPAAFRAEVERIRVALGASRERPQCARWVARISTKHANFEANG
jgi:hypothetical protein